MMEANSLKNDLTILELGREHFPRFSKDATAEEVKSILDSLKEVVRKQKDLLVAKYQDKTGGNEEKIKKINAAANRIFDL